MMSAPDRVDVDIPSVKSTDNLRRMVQEQQQQQQQTNNQQQQDEQQPEQGCSGSHHSQQQQQQKQNETKTGTSSLPEYTAWTIGSTETTQNVHQAPATAVACASDGTIRPPSALLAKCDLADPSNNNNSNNLSSSQLPMTDPTILSYAGSPMPPPAPMVPPTLGGLSQNITLGGFGIQACQSPSPPPQPSQQQQSFAQTTPQPPRYNKPLQRLYHNRLLNAPTAAVESLLASSCESLNFDIAEMWLRTGPKTHQLTSSHVRPTALDESVRKQLVDVYYGERSAERTHRLSPALCKRAKEAGDVVWVTAHTPHGAEALKCSISDVRTAVAVPVCHVGSGVNVTIIYFSIRRAIMRPQAVEFLLHMSLATATASVNSLAEDVMVDEITPKLLHLNESVGGSNERRYPASAQKLSKSAHFTGDDHPPLVHKSLAVTRDGHQQRIYSVTGAQLNLQWESLRNVEYLTDGGNNWIHTAVLHGKSVVIKTLKPECQDVALAINEIEGELEIHSRLDHPNIVKLIGAGYTPRGVRFVVLERLDGGTLSQMLGYDNRIRDRRRRFWTKRKISYMDVLKCARGLADALAYCHGRAIPNVMVLHRDLKPDNLGFTLDGTVKLIDFGLARILENASVSNELYEMSGETGSLRYMAPEVAACQPYNQKADVYSFGIILWELIALQKPYDGMNREEFYSRVVHGGERPLIKQKWPEDLTELMKSCWSNDIVVRPNFSDIVEILDSMLTGEKDGETKKKKPKNKFVSALIDRHSTWF